jgi:hypothetical protein
MPISNRKRVRKSKRIKSRKSLGGYRRTSNRRTSKRRRTSNRRTINTRNHRGGVPNQVLREPLIRLPHTRINIIRGYVRELYEEPDRREEYIQALNEHLDRENFENATENEINVELQRIAGILGH